VARVRWNGQLGFFLRFMNDFKKLFDDFGVQDFPGMAWQNHPMTFLEVGLID